MNEAQVNTVAENDVLKQEFERRGLELSAVWEPTPGDPQLEGRQLRRLLRWVEAYERCPDRKRLTRRGFEFPPVIPDFDPDADWLRFERWMGQDAVEWSFTADFGALKPEEDLSDEELETELERIEELLAGRGVVIGLNDAVPDRIVYRYLKRELETSTFEFLPKNTQCHLDACTGYCPGCVQRPWCDIGQEDTWPEDEEAGRMLVPAEVREYVA
jgi:hypothetical protein